RLQQDVIRLVKRLPKGDIALMLAHKAEEGFKGAVTEVTLEQAQNVMDSDGRGGFGSSLIFEEMGLRYLGPIDGHDLPMLFNCLEFAKGYDKPIVFHVLTKKGKGYDVALAQLEKFHGMGLYDIVTGAPPKPKPGAPPNYQDVFGQAM